MHDAAGPSAYEQHLAAVGADALELAHGALSDDPEVSGDRAETAVTLRLARGTVAEDEDLAVTAVLTVAGEPAVAATGTVYLCVDDEIIAGTEVSGGTAHAVVTFDVGEHLLIAHYIGDAAHHAAESAPTTITVTAAR